MNDLYCVGTTRSTAPLNVFERLSIDRKQRRQLQHTLRRQFGECCVLSTCERIEIYVHANRTVGDHVIDALARTANIGIDRVCPFVSLRCGSSVAEHLFRVAAGMKSRIMGEAQILRQVRSAFLSAKEDRTLGPHLDAMMRGAIHTGKVVRRDIISANSRPSWGKLALNALHRAMAHAHRPAGSIESGRDQGKGILIVGAGSLAAELISRLDRTPFDNVTIVSRNPERTMHLRSARTLRVAHMDELPRLLIDTDAVVACTRCKSPVVTSDMLANRQHPLFVVDLGVPRNVDSTATKNPAIRLTHLDELGKSIIDTDTQAAIERLIERELERFARWRRARKSAPRIAGFLTANVDRHSESRVAIHRAIIRIKEQAAA